MQHPDFLWTCELHHVRMHENWIRRRQLAILIVLRGAAATCNGVQKDRLPLGSSCRPCAAREQCRCHVGAIGLTQSLTDSFLWPPLPEAPLIAIWLHTSLSTS